MEELDLEWAAGQDQPVIAAIDATETEPGIEGFGRVKVARGQIGRDPVPAHVPAYLRPAQKRWIRAQASSSTSSEVA